MGHDVTIDGALYISSKRASELTGYTQDYIGQLARAGKIIARRMGGLWYVLQESILGHKETADSYVPIPPSQVEVDMSDDNPIVSLDGKTYVSAAHAARTTLYNQDYIGQLARAGKILSQQVGNRWYVDIDGLKRHKQEKDALLGAVQASSVGIWKPENDANKSEEQDVQAVSKGTDLHYSYVSESHPLMPVLQKPEESPIEHAIPEEVAEITGPERHMIPIRVIRVPKSTNVISEVQQDEIHHESRVRLPAKSILYKGFTALAFIILIVLAYNLSIFDMSSMYARMVGDSSAAGNEAASSPIRESRAVEIIRGLFSRDLTFERGK